MIDFRCPHCGRKLSMSCLWGVLSYPATTSGLACVAIIAAIPAVWTLMLRHPYLPSVPFSRPGRAAIALIAAYLVWFIGACVRSSAKGAERAPSVLLSGVDRRTMLAQAGYLLGGCAVFILPLIYYLSGDYLTLVISLDQPRSHRSIGVVLVLVLWAVFFFPMSLLAAALRASLTSLHPVFLVCSIRRVLPAYTRLVLLIAVFAVLSAVLLGRFCLRTPSIALRAGSAAAFAYGVLVMAHLLGCFYRRYQDRLDWGT